MDRWIDQSMDWPIDRWIDRCIDLWINWLIDRLIDRWIDGWFDQWVDVSMYGSIRWSINWWIDGLTDVLIDGLMVRWFDGSVVRWFDGSIYWRPCRRQRELERVYVWDREWGFLHCRWKVNTFWDIVDCSQHKCKRKSWFLFYSFLWTCRETAKSKALEIVYKVYAGALKGGRWSEKCQLGRCTNQRWVDISEFFPDTTVFYD